MIGHPPDMTPLQIQENKVLQAQALILEAARDLVNEVPGALSELRKAVFHEARQAETLRFMQEQKP